MAIVHIPSLMRDLTGNQAQLEVEIPPGETWSIRAVLHHLETRFPGIEARILVAGELMPGLAVFIDGEQYFLGLAEKVKPENEVYFLNPIVGGV